jgi:hypothetical protein
MKSINPKPELPRDRYAYLPEFSISPIVEGSKLDLPIKLTDPGAEISRVVKLCPSLT